MTTEIEPSPLWEATNALHEAYAALLRYGRHERGCPTREVCSDDPCECGLGDNQAATLKGYRLGLAGLRVENEKAERQTSAENEAPR